MVAGRVLCLEGGRAELFLEHEHVAHLQQRVRAAQGGPRRAARQAAALVAPGVDLEPVQVGVQRRVVRDLEHGSTRGQCIGERLAAGLEHGGRVGRSRQQRRSLRQRNATAAADLHMDPGAGVAAVVQPVVDQPRVAAHRDAIARRVQIGLGGDRVLPIRQVVGGVSEQFDQRDADIGRRALGPARREHAQAVEHQAPKARVVLGQGVDVGARQRLRRARRHGSAVEIGRAFDLERKLDRREHRVEARRRQLAARIDEQAQGVAREVARRRRPDDECARQVVDAVDEQRVGARGQVVGRGDPQGRDDGNALAAVYAHVVGREREAGAQQAHEQRALAQQGVGLEVVAHLDEFDRVGAARKLQHFEPARVAAMDFHAPPPAKLKLDVCVLASSSTT